jgi:exodeoxyribonuclease V alpha subunit
MESISGLVEHITYYNAENGYTVLRLKPEEKSLAGANRNGLVTVTGNLPELSPGESIRLQGEWGEHPKHGTQFNAEVCEQVLPATVEGLRRYLGSGLLKGIGPKLAERIVDHFGAETLDVIENHPQRLRQVADIGPKRTRQIIAAWEEQKQVKDIMLFLHSHGITTNLAVKIYKQYGDQALGIVQSNPYQLARDVFGVGFKTADRIAQSLGLPSDHATRIEAGIVNLLEEASNDGHVYLPQTALVEKTGELLNIPADLIAAAVQSLAESDLVVVE